MDTKVTCFMSVAEDTDDMIDEDDGSDIDSDVIVSLDSMTEEDDEDDDDDDNDFDLDGSAIFELA